MTIYLEKYDWLVYAWFLDIHKDEELRRCLRYMNCREDTEFIFRDINAGLTYSKDGITCLAIGRTDSAREFANTLIHERKHLESYICKAYHIDPFSEEAAYLAGDIGEKFYTIAHSLLCENCRTKPHRRGVCATS